MRPLKDVFLIGLIRQQFVDRHPTLDVGGGVTKLISREVNGINGRRSVWDGGTRPPLFRAGGQHRNCPPHFSVQKHCEAYSLTQHSSLLKATT